MIDLGRVHHEVKARLREHRRRLSPELWAAFDSLIARRGFLADEPTSLFHPLGQPIATFPLWVSAAVGDDREDRQLDLVEASVAGYLYVRVHDDRLDEDLGDPDEALFLADSFLIRHQSLLARHVGASERFWELFEAVATAYATAMLLERAVTRPGATYGREEFERILDRSHPLILPGAAQLDAAGRWDLLASLRVFVHHAVRAAQLVDDLLDCEVDRAAGRLTWIVRRLGGEAGPEPMKRALVGGGVDDILTEALDDIDAADRAARASGLLEARSWLGARRSEVVDLQERILRRFLLG